jgi:hypothetical protein
MPRAALPLLLLIAAIATAPAAARPEAPRLLGLHVTNGSTTFLGDNALLTTVSPNGDGFRDAAHVSFRLTAPARISLAVVRLTEHELDVITRFRDLGGDLAFLAGNNHVLARPRRRAADEEGRAVARRGTARGVARRRAVRRLQSRRRPGAVRSHPCRAGALALRGDRVARRLDVRPLRDRDRRDRAGVASEQPVSTMLENLWTRLAVP